MRTTLGSTALLAAVAMCGCSDSATQPLDSTASSMLVSAAWLSGKLNDPDLRVLHVGSAATYAEGHIPGARLLPLASIAVTRGSIPFELPDVATLEGAFEAVGVSDDSHVVLYGDLGGMAAARAFFTLDFLGHGLVSLLDGGLDAWRAAGLAVTTDIPAPVTGLFTPAARAARLITSSELRDRMGEADVVLIDARAASDYTGAAAPTATIPRPGHIPGAQSLFWQQHLLSDVDPRFAPLSVLRTQFLSLPGLRYPDAVGMGGPLTDWGPRLVVAYCAGGMMSSVTYFVARYLGYDVKLYDGSFAEWSQLSEMPVAR